MPYALFLYGLDNTEIAARTGDGIGQRTGGVELSLKHEVTVSGTVLVVHLTATKQQK